MTRQEIEAVFARVLTWPEDRQEDAIEMLLGMEERGAAPYELSDEERAALDEGEASGVASEAEIEAVLGRYR